MSAHNLQHVREQLQQATQLHIKGPHFDEVEYQLATTPFGWSDCLLAADIAIRKGWLLKVEPGQVPVTKLRFVRPVKFSPKERAEVLCVLSPEIRQVPSESFSSPASARPHRAKKSLNEEREAQTEFKQLRALRALELTEEPELAEEPGLASSQIIVSEKVVAAYFNTHSGKRVTLAGVAKLQKALTYWTAAQLMAAVDAAVAKHQVTSMAQLFGVRNVAQLLSQPIPSGAAATWLTPYEHIYRNHFPLGIFRYGYWAKYLELLEGTHGVERTCAEFDGYLSKTKASYLAAPKFADGFGTWGAAGSDLAAHDGPVTARVL